MIKMSVMITDFEQASVMNDNDRCWGVTVMGLSFKHRKILNKKESNNYEKICLYSMWLCS